MANKEKIIQNNETLQEIEEIVNSLPTYIDTTNADAEAANLLSGKTAYVNSKRIVGTMANNGVLTLTPSISQQIIGEGYISGGTLAAVTSNIDSNIKAENIKLGVTILGVQGNLEPDKPDQTKEANPTTSQQIIRPDTGYELASVTINAVTNSIDNNIKAENIKEGISILGVTGSVQEKINTSDATATAESILDTKTAYVNDLKITGTMSNNGELTYTPTLNGQTIPQGYTSGGIIESLEDSEDYIECLEIVQDILV